MCNRTLLANISHGSGFGIMTWYVSAAETLQIPDIGEIPLHAGITRLYRYAGILYARTNEATAPRVVIAFYLATMQHYDWTLDTIEPMPSEGHALYFKHAQRSGRLKIEVHWLWDLGGTGYTAIDYQWLDASALADYTSGVCTAGALRGAMFATD